MSAEKTAKATAEKRPAGEKSVKTSEVKKVARAPRATTKRSEKVAEKAVEKIETVAAVENIELATQEKVAAKKKSTAVKTVRSATTLAHAVGRRKAAVARVFLKLGTGVITVNGEPAAEYFDTDITREAARAPFKAVPAAMRYDVLVNVCGGGISGQADAVKLAIARALLKVDAEVKPLLRMNGLLTVDDRIKERKKFGRKAARRGFQFVKR